FSREILDGERPVDRRWGLFLRAVIAHVLDDSDDLTPLGTDAPFVDSLAKRGRSGAPMFPGEIFGNQDNRAAPLDIGPGQAAPRYQASSGGAQKAGGHKLEGSEPLILL